jgi:alanine dehydrogenase
MGIRKVTPKELLNKTYDEPVYAQLNPRYYNKRKDGKPFDREDFYQNPQEYVGDFEKYTKVADMLIAGAYWDMNAPVLFTKEDARLSDFNLEVIADITCDIEGSIPSTKQPSTINDPFYDYNPTTESIESAFTNEKNISVMAVDNLPNELPRDASEAFGQQFIKYVLPNLVDPTNSGMIARATICENGELTENYAYLQDFVDGKE